MSGADFRSAIDEVIHDQCFETDSQIGQDAQFSRSAARTVLTSVDGSSESGNV
jgi:hypothetical protein